MDIHSSFYQWCHCYMDVENGVPAKQRRTHFVFVSSWFTRELMQHLLPGHFTFKQAT